MLALKKKGEAEVHISSTSSCIVGKEDETKVTQVRQKMNNLALWCPLLDLVLPILDYSFANILFVHGQDKHLLKMYTVT